MPKSFADVPNPAHGQKLWRAETMADTGERVSNAWAYDKTGEEWISQDAFSKKYPSAPEGQLEFNPITEDYSPITESDRAGIKELEAFPPPPPTFDPVSGADPTTVIAPDGLGDTGGLAGDSITAPQGTPPPGGGPSIVADNLVEQQPTEIPPFEGGSSTADSTASGVEETVKSIDDYIAMLEPDTPSDTQTKLDTLISDFEGTMGENEGRGAEQLAQEEAQGVQQKKETLTAIQDNIRTKMAEFNQLQTQLAELSANVEGRPMTMQSIVGSQSQIQNKLMAQKNSFAADIGLLQAQALGAQGRLNDAQAAADRAVDLKYMDIQQRLQNQATLIGLYEGKLSKEEQTRANAINLYLKDQERIINDKKEQEKLIQQAMTIAASNGFTSDQIADVANSATLTEAYQKLAHYTPQTVGAPVTKSLGPDLYQWNEKIGNWELAIKGATSSSASNPITQKVGPDLYQYDPATGQWNMAIKAGTEGTTAADDPGNKIISLTESITWGVPPGTTMKQLQDMILGGVIKQPSQKIKDPEILTTPKGEIINQPYYRVEGTNEVYDLNGTHMDGDKWKAVGEPWTSVQVVSTAPSSDALKAYQGTVGDDDGGKLLSPSEAKTLGVPYGTTREQAAAMGITPKGTSPNDGTKPWWEKDFTLTQRIKLEAKFGPNWMNESRQNLINEIGSSGVDQSQRTPSFTDDYWRRQIKGGATAQKSRGEMIAQLDGNKSLTNADKERFKFLINEGTVWEDEWKNANPGEKGGWFSDDKPVPVKY